MKIRRIKNTLDFIKDHARASLGFIPWVKQGGVSHIKVTWKNKSGTFTTKYNVEITGTKLPQLTKLF